jgi:hypothetical protein
MFRWSLEAKQLVGDYQERIRTSLPSASTVRTRLIAQLVEVSGHPRDACLRFLRRLGAFEKRSYREWTKPEQQRLIELIDSMPVAEVARVLRRPVSSVRSMLHRLGLGVRQSREWFTLSLLAETLQISRNEVERWVARGWLQCRAVETSGLKMRIVDPDDFCEFVKQHGREVVGRRLTYDGLLFVRNYVLPPKHAELLSVRGPYKKRSKSASETNGVDRADTYELAEEDDAVDRSA